MKLGLCSDLHLDHISSEDEGTVVSALKPILANDFDCLLIAGDISVTNKLSFHIKCLDKVFPNKYFVLGNHDHWGSYFTHAWEKVKNNHQYIHGKRIPLTPETILVGVDGWFDARAGREKDIYNTNDLNYIGDLSVINRIDSLILEKIRSWADADAKSLAQSLEGLVGVERVVILTHYPPWPNPDDSAKFYAWSVCNAVGSVIESVARANPHIRFDVICGHTHHKWQAKILLDNINLNVLPAEYSNPALSGILEI